MASENRDPNTHPHKIEIAHNIQAWFTLETMHQVTAGFKKRRGTVTEMRDTLLTKQVRNEWNRFRRRRMGTEIQLDEEKRLLGIGQSVLKACVAAQSAYAWHEVERGSLYGDALLGSLIVVDGFVDQVKAGKELPRYRLLGKPVRDAVNEYATVPNAFYRPVSTFNSLLYLATSAINEQFATEQDFFLPKPAVIDDDVLIPWKHH